jgi:hypothetical protein
VYVELLPFIDFAHAVLVCALYDPHIRQRLFPLTSLSDMFIMQVRCVFCEVGIQYIYIILNISLLVFLSEILNQKKKHKTGPKTSDSITYFKHSQNRASSSSGNRIRDPVYLAGYSQTAGPRWRSLLRHCATNRKVAGSIPDGVTGFFH